MRSIAEKVFEDELLMIGNPDIKEFVLTCFDKLTPDYFWTAPASTTWKYHPQISLNRGGLVRHTKLAVWWGIELMSCWTELYDGMIDELVAALLLHDLKKNGDKLDAKGYPTLKNSTAFHGVYLAEQITNTLSDSPMIDSINRIIGAIKTHMGRWTSIPVVHSISDNQSNLGFIVHLADYCASRKCDSIVKEISEIYNSERISITYAVGQLDGENGIGFWDGPTPSLINMMAVTGKDDKSVIVQFDPIRKEDRIIYTWNSDQGKWVEHDK